ncbi:quinone oxidoreductase family protein [Jatrophihabitans telluris]|uniref:quinone oxidoreductase family protein n=1 Tax=Jatrophihabitans telluris TaxID=2038343 RepID=UPI0032217997
MTQALVVTRTGGSEVLEVRTQPVTAPASGEVVVDVAAAGVNFMDVYQRQGIYPVDPPFVLGSEGAGTVAELGAHVLGVERGDVVAWPHVRGTAAGRVTVPADSVVPVPEGVPAELAAALMLQGLTAHYLVNSTFPVQSGHTVLVHAAAGGVGQLLTQLAKAKGATVIGTVGSAAKADKARSVGVDHVIDYTQFSGADGAGLARAVRDLTGGQGVDVVYDGVGKDTFDASLASLRIRGTLALFGGASGQVPPFDIQRLNSGGSLFLTRPTLGHHLRTRDELLGRSKELFDAVLAGSLKVEIGGRYPLADAARAYDDLEGRRTMGKLLLIP